ncbi:MAG: flagellar assembly protein FliW [Thermodesulfobacteriota bacterium]|nr:flagellar assembly protein FliW [Thermodesulfobacteriota bacterium]
MELKTVQFGTIDVTDDRIVTMPAGMPGFPDQKHFIVLELPRTRPFLWYQSVDDPGLAFSIIRPWLFVQDYSVDTSAVINEMGWDKSEESSLEVYVIVNAAGKSAEEITANLMGPLLINPTRRQAAQFIIHNGSYSHEHPVFRRN